MVGPHYIELLPVNFDTIIKWTPATREALEENYKDSQETGIRYYIRFSRIANGIPTWMCYTDIELMEEFSMNSIDPRSQTRFVLF